MRALRGFRPPARRPRTRRGRGRSAGVRCRPPAGPVTRRPACATPVSRDEPSEVGRTHRTRSAGEPRTGGRGPQRRHLDRATRSLRSEGRPAGPRARQAVDRGHRTGQEHRERSPGTDADVHLVSPPSPPRQAARPSQPSGQDQGHGGRWTHRHRGHRAAGRDRDGGPTTGPDPRVAAVARAERVDPHTGPRRKAPHGESHGRRSSPPAPHGPGSGSHRCAGLPHRRVGWQAGTACSPRPGHAACTRGREAGP
jgi:hypothetical protein